MRSATAFKSVSPAACPRESFTVLKLSRSMKRIATCVARRAGGGEDELQPVEEQRAVRQPRERVVVGEEMDARLRRLAVADVAHHAHAVELALVRHHAPLELDRNARAVLGQDRGLVRALVAGAHVRDDPVAAIGRHVLDDLAADQLLVPVPGEPQDRLVAVGHAPVLLEDDAFVRGVGELAQALLALARLGDVMAGAEVAHEAAVLVVDRDRVVLDPAEGAVGALDAVLLLEAAPQPEGLGPVALERFAVVRVHGVEPQQPALLLDVPARCSPPKPDSRTSSPHGGPHTRRVRAAH
jgi:hypothetical protein